MHSYTEKSTVIISRSNPAFKRLVSLHNAKKIEQNGRFLVGGEKVIKEVLRDHPENITAWISSPGQPDFPGIPRIVNRITLAGKLFDELNLTGTNGPMLELRLPGMSDFKADAAWPGGCSLFIPFGDPENVGAVIRSAAAMGVGRVVLLQESASPFLPRAVRASAGAVLRVRLERGPSMNDMADLQASYPIMSLDMHGQDLVGVKWPETFGLIAGKEGTGLPAAITKKYKSVSIPLAKGIDSLNACAAVSIALWDWKFKIKKTASGLDVQG